MKFKIGELKLKLTIKITYEISWFTLFQGHWGIDISSVVVGLYAVELTYFD